MTSRRDSRGPDYEDDERFAEWVDGCMSERDRDRFEAEMRVNARLREAAERYRRTVESVRTVLRAEGPQIDVADAVLARIAGRTAAPAAAPDPSPARGPMRASHGSPFRWRALLASVSVAAALVALFVWLDRIEPAVRSDEMAAAPEAARAADEDREIALLDRSAREGQWMEDGNAAGGRREDRSAQGLDLQDPEARAAEEKSSRALVLEQSKEQAERSAGAAAPPPAAAAPEERPATDPAAVAERAPLAESMPGNEEAKGGLPSPGAAAKPRAQAPDQGSPKAAKLGSAATPEADRSANPLAGAGSLGGPTTPGPAGPTTPGPAGPSTPGPAGPASRGPGGPATGGAPDGKQTNDRDGQSPPTFGARGSRGNGNGPAPEPTRREVETRVEPRAEQRDADEVAAGTGIASTLPLLTFAPQAATDKDKGPGQQGQAEAGRPEDGEAAPTRSRAAPGDRSGSGERAGAAAETKRRSQPEASLLAMLDPAAAGSPPKPPAAGETPGSPMPSGVQDELRSATPAPRVRRLQTDATAIRTIAPGMFAVLPGDAFLIEGDEAQVKAFLGRLAAVAQRERFDLQTAEIPLGLVEALTPALPADSVQGGRVGEAEQAGQAGERPAELGDDPAQPEATGATARERSRADDARRRDTGAGAEPSAPGKPIATVRVVVVLRDTPLPPPATAGDQKR